MTPFNTLPYNIPNPGRTIDMSGGQDAADAAAAAEAERKKRAESDALFEHVRRLTEGRAKELQNDPVQAQIKDYLGGVINGQNAPFSESVVNALQGQQAHGSATAQGVQMESLRQALAASGGSPYDPSFQAAQRESDAMRQGQNMDYAGQLRAQAGLENFNASSNAAKSLAGINQGQNSQINQLDLAGAGYRNARFTEQATPGVLMPQYNPSMPQGGAEPSRQNEGQVDNKFASPQQPQGWTVQGTKPVPQAEPRTPSNDASMAGPPAPTPYSAAAGFANPNRVQQPQNAVGGYTPVPGMDVNSLIAALQNRRSQT